MAIRDCKRDPCKDADGNCLIPGTDSLPVQCVGPWVEDKYFFLERYLNASCEARRMFADKGNAVYIDLFAGPGKCIIRGPISQQREIESGVMRVLHREEAPFNAYYLFDLSMINTDALSKRTSGVSNIHIEHGDSNVLTDGLVTILQQTPWRYHFAYIDPFGPDNLKFQTLKKLASLDRIDMLIHFPIGAIKRNIKTWIAQRNTILDEFLGTNDWRTKLSNNPPTKTFSILLDVFKGQLEAIGFPEEGLRLAPSDRNIYPGLPTVPVRNTKDVELYVLILASKHKLAQKIWNSAIKVSPEGQRSLF